MDTRAAPLTGGPSVKHNRTYRAPSQTGAPTILTVDFSPAVRFLAMGAPHEQPESRNEPDHGCSQEEGRQTMTGGEPRRPGPAVQRDDSDLEAESARRRVIEHLHDETKLTMGDVHEGNWSVMIDGARCRCRRVGGSNGDDSHRSPTAGTMPGDGEGLRATVER